MASHDPPYKPPDLRVPIFYVYSQTDGAARHSLILRLCRMTPWSLPGGHREIPADQSGDPGIDEAVDQARMVLFLVSSAFLALDYCHGREVRRILERHAAGEAVVMVVLLEPVDLHGTPFETLLVLPSNRIPVNRWLPRGGVWVKIGLEIQTILEAITNHGQYGDRNRLTANATPDRPTDPAPLGRQDIADLLQRIAFPMDPLAVQVNIVAELHRLSQGDPFLIHRYIEDLAQRGEEALTLRAEELASIAPGPEGYFQRWWKDQHRRWGQDNPLAEKQVREVLAILACAFGPLRREELLAVADPDLWLNDWTLDRTLKPLWPFIVGDGMAQSYLISRGIMVPGLMIRNARLRRFFHDRMTPEERSAVEERFIAWGNSAIATLRGEGGMDVVPRYVARNYILHLQRANKAIDAFLPLLDHGWQRTRLTVGGGHGHLLNDLHAVWQRLEAINAAAADRHEPLPYLAEEVRCALCEASVRSLTAKPSAVLTARLVETGIWQPTQGVAVLRRLPDDWQRADFMAPLAAALAGVSIGPRDSDRNRLFGELLDMVQATDGDYRRQQALEELAPHLPATLVPRALAVARGIGPKYDRERCLLSLLPWLSASDRSRALDEILAMAPDARRDAKLRLHYLRRLVPHLPMAQRAEVLDEVLTLVKAVYLDDEWNRDELDVSVLLRQLVAYLPTALQEKALTLAHRSSKTSRGRARDLKRLAAHLSPPWQQAALEAALEAAQRAEAEAAQERAMAPPPPTLEEEARQYEQQLLTTFPSLSSEERASRLAAYRERRLAERREKDCLDRVHDLRTRALNASAAERDGLLIEALVTAREIDDEGKRIQILDRRVRSPSSAVIEAMLTLASTLSDDSRRSEALTKVSRYCAEPRLTAVLGEALTALLTIGDDPARTRALQALTAYPVGKQETTTATDWTGASDQQPPSAIVVPFPYSGTEAALHRLLRTGLRRAASRSRVECLHDLRFLLPLIHKLGGNGAIDGTFRAIQDVCRWWP